MELINNIRTEKEVNQLISKLKNELSERNDKENMIINEAINLNTKGVFILAASVIKQNKTSNIIDCQIWQKLNIIKSRFIEIDNLKKEINELYKMKSQSENNQTDFINQVKNIVNKTDDK